MIYILEIVVREECEHVAYSDPTWKTKKKKKEICVESLLEFDKKLPLQFLVIQPLSIPFPISFSL